HRPLQRRLHPDRAEGGHGHQLERPDHALQRHRLLDPLLGHHADRLRLDRAVRVHRELQVLTALVVDADSDARRRVAGLLHLAGWDVHQASTAEALRTASALDLDLVVTEAWLPGASGP